MEDTLLMQQLSQQVFFDRGPTKLKYTPNSCEPLTGSVKASTMLRIYREAVNGSDKSSLQRAREGVSLADVPRASTGGPPRPGALAAKETVTVDGSRTLCASSG